MDNLHIYEKVRQVPQNALKLIQAGRLKGKSDINPMWRIKTLTEQFGPCGIGWKYTITKQWTEIGANGEVSAFVNIDLYVKYDGQWSEPIPGTGGSMFITNERNGLYTSDECYKMALTDAISVSCKALGVAADVYWDSDRTKYSPSGKAEQDESHGELGESKIDSVKVQTLKAMIRKTGADESKLLAYYNVKKLEEMTISAFALAMAELEKRIEKQQKSTMSKEIPESLK